MSAEEFEMQDSYYVFDSCSLFETLSIEPFWSNVVFFSYQKVNQKPNAFCRPKPS